MPFQATPVLLFVASLVIVTTPLQAQNAALEAGCTREKVKAPSPANTKQGALNAARVRVVEGVRESVARRAAEAGIAEPKGVFVLSADKDRSTVKLAAGRTNLPAPLLETVAAESAHLFAGWPEKGAATVAVRLDSIPIPEVPVGAERTFCKPRTLNGIEISRALQEHIAGRPALVTKSGSQATVRFLLTRDGEILAPELAKVSGSYQWGQTALELAHKGRYTPARVDGIAYDAWTTIPFNMKGSTR